MDLTKAFDYVDHQILMDKLSIYGIRGNAFSLINSYLTDRQQMTQITRLSDDKTETAYISEPKTVTTGVPQGSILGPLLFITYINDFPTVTNHQMVLFADDSTVIFIGDNLKSFEHEINSTIENIINWLTCNNLIINLDKTKIMTFTNRRNKLSLDIKYHDKQISEITHNKFLGLHIDDCLNWKTHIEILCMKLNRFSFALHMLSKVVNQSAVLIAFNAYVTSSIRYGIIFWGNSCNKDKIFKCQKKCIRAICHLKPTDSCKQYFDKFKILTYPSLYLYEVLVFIKTNNQLFKYSNNERRKNKLCFMQHATALFGNSIFNMAPRIYNKLPPALADRNLNIITFKNKIKDFLL